MLRMVSLRVSMAALLLCVAACTTTLAPRYDQAVVDGLSGSSVQLMQLFAALASGADKTSFTSRQRGYNRLIGRFDALAVQARARPMPTRRSTQRASDYLARRGLAAVDGDEPASALAMEKIARTLAKMKQVDAKQGLSAIEVAAFKGQVLIYLDQALTYESFLKR
ncbi:hypothetical protein [Spongiibacter sp.]|uniref:hypothetical protein n=1 Tax=Spongiibacter sp. TaxID=2024860 RepID=UPI003566DE82